MALNSRRTMLSGRRRSRSRKCRSGETGPLLQISRAPSVTFSISDGDAANEAQQPIEDSERMRWTSGYPQIDVN
jgi:hypothetical protein